MEGTIARTLQVLIALSGAYLLALWVVLVIWTYRDSESRSRSVVTQVFSTMLAALFFVPGVLLYMMLRPKESLDMTFQRSLEEEYLLQDIEGMTTCFSCHQQIEDDFVVCPHCHSRLKEPCLNCGEQFDVRWSVCPYCAHEKGVPVTTIRPVIQPIDRYVQSQPRMLMGDIPVNRAIEQLESQAFNRLEPVPQPVAIAAMSGRAFDRRKTREMNRNRMSNGHVSNGGAYSSGSSNGAAPEAPIAQDDAEAVSTSADWSDSE